MYVLVPVIYDKTVLGGLIEPALGGGLAGLVEQGQHLPGAPHWGRSLHPVVDNLCRYCPLRNACLSHRVMIASDLLVAIERKNGFQYLNISFLVEII